MNQYEESKIPCDTKKYDQSLSFTRVASNIFNHGYNDTSLIFKEQSKKNAIIGFEQTEGVGTEISLKLSYSGEYSYEDATRSTVLMKIDQQGDIAEIIVPVSEVTGKLEDGSRIVVANKYFLAAVLGFVTDKDVVSNLIFDDLFDPARSRSSIEFVIEKVNNYVRGGIAVPDLFLRFTPDEVSSVAFPNPAFFAEIEYSDMTMQTERMLSAEPEELPLDTNEFEARVDPSIINQLLREHLAKPGDTRKLERLCCLVRWNLLDADLQTCFRKLGIEVVDTDFNVNLRHNQQNIPLGAVCHEVGSLLLTGSALKVPFGTNVEEVESTGVDETSFTKRFLHTDGSYSGAEVVVWDRENPRFLLTVVGRPIVSKGGRGILLPQLTTETPVYISTKNSFDPRATSRSFYLFNSGTDAIFDLGVAMLSQHLRKQKFS